MSGIAPRLVPQFPSDMLPNSRSPLAHLLHALNQPLTGLHCALELAMAAPRRREEYVGTLRESLELAARMRILLEGIRELIGVQEKDQKEGESLLLNVLLREVAEELCPVAKERKVHLLISSDVPLRVRASRSHLAALIFRLLESALSLAREGSEFRVAARPEEEQAIVSVSWSPGPVPEHSPFSRPELGLLIARAGWERGGAEWASTQTESPKTCTIRLSLPCLAPSSQKPD